jgi:hypothetical protein
MLYAPQGYVRILIVPERIVICHVGLVLGCGFHTLAILSRAFPLGSGVEQHFEAIQGKEAFDGKAPPLLASITRNPVGTD